MLRLPTHHSPQGTYVVLSPAAGMNSITMFVQVVPDLVETSEKCRRGEGEGEGPDASHASSSTPTT